MKKKERKLLSFFAVKHPSTFESKTKNHLIGSNPSYQHVYNIVSPFLLSTLFFGCHQKVALA